jgi:5'(3')-deoxyribonucleotidase
MDLIPDALDTIRELSKYCEITIATHRPRKSDNPTKKWLRKNNIPFDNYINTSKTGKGLVKGNIIIDDYPNNAINFVKQTQKGRTAYLFTQPWNKDDQSIKSYKNIIRVNVWKDVLKQIAEYLHTQ